MIESSVDGHVSLIYQSKASLLQGCENIVALLPIGSAVRIGMGPKEPSRHP